MIVELLDSVEKYLTNQKHLQAQLSRAHLLTTRFKLGGFEINTNDLIQSSNTTDLELDIMNDCETRNRLSKNKTKNNIVDTSSSRFLTKNDQIMSLKALYTRIVEDEIIPLALIKRQIDHDIVTFKGLS